MQRLALSVFISLTLLKVDAWYVLKDSIAYSEREKYARKVTYAPDY